MNKRDAGSAPGVGAGRRGLALQSGRQVKTEQTDRIISLMLKMIENVTVLKYTASHGWDLKFKFPNSHIK